MGPRRKSREYALEILYQMDLRHKDLDEYLTIFNEYWEEKKKKYTPTTLEEIKDFTAKIVKGVLQHMDELDEVLCTYIEDWYTIKISKIDRSIMRIAMFEMMFLPDIPETVTINEAIEIAKRYGAEESSQFVNGVLDKIFKTEVSG